MNRVRRKKLEDLVGQIQDIRDMLEQVTEEEEQYRDNMPENLQESEKYAKAEEDCDSLRSAVDSLDEAVAYIGDIGLIL